MKNIFTILTLWIIPFSFSNLSLSSNYFDQKNTTTYDVINENISFKNFPLGKAISVDFGDSELHDENLSRREQIDQIRDWLFITIASNIGFSEEDFNRITYDMPMIRYEFMNELSYMEYGKTRSRYIGDKAIIGLIPKCSKKEKLDYLSHLADNHRKDLDIIPEIIYVFEYEIGLDDELATLKRLENFNAEKLFTRRNGYFEKEIRGIYDLKFFIENTEDITYGEVLKNGNLKLGGRKIQSRNYGKIELEDIAAIYQSERYLEKLFKMMKIQMESEKLGNEELTEETKAKIEKIKYSYGSGFSLDPTYDFKKLIELVEKNKVIFKNITPSFSSIQKSLREKNENDLMRALGEIINKYPERKRAAIILSNEIRNEHEYQKSRYDGYLKGTSVGMNLFYTDLIAKLWTINFDFSSPEFEIEDFVCDTKVQTSKVFDQENEVLNSVRLWFGTEDRNVQFSKNKNKLLFGRCATKIFAASSNQFLPGAENEVEASAFWGASINWWNNHYEEVARYEPEYEKLNENMKWSLIISWLQEKQQLETLSFLDQIQVKRDNWFPQWAKSKKELKFQEWETIKFYKKGFLGNSTEVLPKLKSPPSVTFSIISGGVSLGSKAEINAITSVPKNPRHGGISHRAANTYNEVFGEIKTQDGKGFKLSKNEVSSTPKETSKFRTSSSQLPNSPIKRDVRTKDNSTQISLKHSEQDLGMLEIAPSKNGFQVGMKSRMLDKTQSIARQLSDAENPFVYLKQSLDVENFLMNKNNALNQNVSELYFLPRNSSQWVKAEIGAPSSLDINPSSVIRSAGINANSKICEIKIVPKRIIDNLIEQKGLKMYRARGDLPNWQNRTLYSENLQKIDILIAKKDFGRAREGLSEMAKISKKPNHEILIKRDQLIIEEASILLENGNGDKAINLFNNLVNNINNSGPKQSDIYRAIKETLKKQNLPFETKRVLKDYLRYNYSPENFSLISKVNVDNFIGKGTKISREEFKTLIKETNCKVFVQDKPGLNNNDWTPSVKRSINMVFEKYPNAVIERFPKKSQSLKLELGKSDLKYNFKNIPNLNLNLRTSDRFERYDYFSNGNGNGASPPPIDSTSFVFTGKGGDSSDGDYFYIIYLEMSQSLLPMINGMAAPSDSTEFKQFQNEIEILFNDINKK